MHWFQLWDRIRDPPACMVECSILITTIAGTHTSRSQETVANNVGGFVCVRLQSTSSWYHVVRGDPERDLRGERQRRGGGHLGLQSLQIVVLPSSFVEVARSIRLSVSILDW